MLLNAIVFDIGDTLSEDRTLRERAVEHSARELGYRGRLGDVDAFIDAYWKVEASISGPTENHLFTSPHLVGRVLMDLGMEPDPEVLYSYIAIHRTYVWSQIEPNEGLQAFCRYLRERGILLGILTDGSSVYQYRILERLGILRYVDALVTSEDVGALKPSLEGFRRLLDRLGTTPERILMVGNDVEKDIAPARRLGMRCALVERGATTDLDDFPDQVVLNSVLDLYRALEAGVIRV